jgi:hypothetical protein
MILQDIIVDIHALTEDLEMYERKYGVLTETFYELYSNGIEPEDDTWVLDWSDWAGVYQLLVRRQKQYRQTIELLKSQTQSLLEVIGRTARHDPISVAS